MTEKILIVANLKAGRGKANKYINEIKFNLNNQNFDVDVKYTTLQNSATNIIKNYPENYDKLIICGGDGTLNQAVQALCQMDKKVPIAYIPMGTTNDFAKSLNVSFDKVDISNNIKDYVSKEVDVGKFNDSYFNYVASIGVFSKTSYSTSADSKNKFGRLAYMYLGAQELLKPKTYHLKIFSEGSIIEDEFIYGSVSNSKYVGGFHMFKDDNMKMDDGKFEAVFVKKPKNAFETFKLAMKVTNGNFDDENIYSFKTSNLKIESPEITEWSIDGEYSGKVSDIKITNNNKKMEYIVPKIKEEF